MNKSKISLSDSFLKVADATLAIWMYHSVFSQKMLQVTDSIDEYCLSCQVFRI